MKFGSQHTYLVSDAALIPPDVVAAICSSDASCRPVVDAWRGSNAALAAVALQAFDSNVRLVISAQQHGVSCDTDAVQGTLHSSNKSAALVLLGKVDTPSDSAPDVDDEPPRSSGSEAGSSGDSDREEVDAAEASGDASGLSSGDGSPDPGCVRFVAAAASRCCVITTDESVVGLRFV